jgi:hypothetical protein
MCERKRAPAKRKLSELGLVYVTEELSKFGLILIED